MTDTIVTMQVSFEVLVKAISALSLKDKNRLWELLYEQIEQEEEDLMEQDPEIAAAMEQARAELAAGNYVTFDEYDAQRSQATK